MRVPPGRHPSSAACSHAGLVALWILGPRRIGFRFAAADLFRLSRYHVRRILRIGLPSVGGNVCWWTAFMTITSFASQLGVESLSTHSYLMQLLLRILALLEPGCVMNVIVVFAMRATGDARYPLKVGVAVLWGAWVLIAWLFGLKLGLGLTGIWIAMIINEWTRKLLNFRRSNSRRWLVHAERSRNEALADRADQPPPGSHWFDYADRGRLDLSTGVSRPDHLRAHKDSLRDCLHESFTTLGGEITKSAPANHGIRRLAGTGSPD